MYYLCHGFDFSPLDLLWLSHINRQWRACAINDPVFSSWFKVLAKCRRMKRVQVVTTRQTTGDSGLSERATGTGPERFEA